MLYLTSILILALDFVTPWCCDRPNCRHSEGFDWSSYFLGDVYTGKQPGIRKSRAGKPKNRAMKERPLLRSLLTSWRSAAHRADPLRSVRPATFIIDNVKIKLLASIGPTRIRIPSHVTEFLSETKEWSACWALAIFDVIHRFDNPPVPRSPSPTLSDISQPSSAPEPPRKRRRKTIVTSPPPASFRIRIPPRPRPVLKEITFN